MREQHREDGNTYGACVALQGYTNYALDPKKGTYAQVPNHAPPFMGVNPAGNPTPQYTSYAAQAPASYGTANSPASQTPVWQQVLLSLMSTQSQAARHSAEEVAWPLFREQRYWMQSHSFLLLSAAGTHFLTLHQVLVMQSR